MRPPGTSPRRFVHPRGAPLQALLYKGLIGCLGLFLLIGAGRGHCTEDSSVQTQWGGHLRAIGTISWPEDQSIYALSNVDTPYYDGQVEGRLKNQLFFGSHWRLETHYEVVWLGGDTRDAGSQLANSLPAADIEGLVGSQEVNDDRRLMNLTHIIDDGDRSICYHRLDRLNLSYTAAGKTLRVGRQALTWGNGLVFNPMDLFNPFAPTAVQRDYKAGEDMVHLQLPVGNSDAQLLFVPRRDPDSGDIAEDQASYAAKWHLPLNSLEVDLMAARHYGDAVAGAGVMGYLGGAAWRLDAVLTLPDQDDDPEAYMQIVANIDYAWQWGGKNLYGLLEYYHNGLGRNDQYDLALSDPLISERLDRGELFTLGRDYLAGTVNIQWHPLVQTRLAALVNMADGSGFCQPQLLWDVGTNWQMIVGASLYWGEDDSEYGGFETSVVSTPIEITPTQSAYIWLSYYF